MRATLLAAILTALLICGIGCRAESADQEPEVALAARAAGLSRQNQGFSPPGGGRAEAEAEGTTRPNVLMIALDNVRANRMSSYGGPNPTTPVLDALAARGTRFAHCIAQAPYTPHSFASMLSGLYVADLPVRPRSRKPRPVVRAGLESFHVTLAEALEAHGYVTGAIVSGWFTEAFGLQQGFDWVSYERRTTKEVVEVARDYLSRWKASGIDSPFFLFAYSLDVHAEFMSQAPGRQNVFGGDPQGLRYAREQMQRISRGELEPTEADLANARTLYDEGLYWTDHELGPLLGALEELGIAENTIVVFVSDHGEEFREHGFYGHGQSNFGAVIDVPLIVYDPRTPGPRVVDHRVMNVDVLPTVLDLVGAPIPAAARGVSLAPSIHGEEQPELPARLLYSEGATNGYVGAVIAGDYKLHVRRAGRRRLYDLASDPDESTDLARRHPKLAERLERLLWTHKRDGLAHQVLLALDAPLVLDEMSLPEVDLSTLTAAVGGEEELTDETIEQLKSLGYLN